MLFTNAVVSAAFVKSIEHVLAMHCLRLSIRCSAHRYLAARDPAFTLRLAAAFSSLYFLGGFFRYRNPSHSSMHALPVLADAQVKRSNNNIIPLPVTARLYAGLIRLFQ